MKVIDLINDIYNNKKLPKHIKIDGIIYNLAENYKNYNINYIYENEYEDYWLDQVMLDEEVEIIEEEKEIEEIEVENGDIVDYDEIGVHFIKTNRKDRNIYINKINELVRELNKIKKEGK